MTNLPLTLAGLSSHWMIHHVVWLSVCSVQMHSLLMSWYQKRMCGLVHTLLVTCVKRRTCLARAEASHQLSLTLASCLYHPSQLVFLWCCCTCRSPEVGQQGRMESSYAAIKLAEKCVASGQLGSVSIFLHDAGRPLEKEIMKKLFATHAWVESMGVLNGAGSRLLAGYVVTQHQQPEKHRGPDNKESATFPQNGNQQQQQQKLHSTRMADDQWTHFPGAAIVPAAYGASSSHWSVPAYPFLSHLGYLLLGIICGVMLRSWCRGLGQRKHVAGSLYIPIRSS